MQRFRRPDLCDLARDMLAAGGLPAERAATVAELLVRTDEIGVHTHGISMIPYYLPELASGNMAREGDPETLADRGATLVWDGCRLPGHWLMARAIPLAMERARIHGTCTLTIRRSHHIGCLSTLLRLAVDEGFVCLIATSDPSGRWVAPFGGVEPMLTPNPWAVGYPAGDTPVLIDTCASITTVSNMRAHLGEGRSFDRPRMLDAAGRESRDPKVIEAGGTLLPTGGTDHGHKGFALGLMVEMLTQGLSGFGRADGVEGWGANVFLQVMDPDAFAGRDAFERQTGWLSARCRSSAPVPGGPPVRMPGDRAAAARAASATGIAIPDEVWRRVAAAAEGQRLPLPQPIGGSA